MKFGVYLHIPFCISKCSYCDFFTVIGKESAIPRYVDALCAEIELYADTALEADTVYFGGGTPSLLPPEAMEGILAKLVRSFDLAGRLEVTCETNPETVDAAKLRSFRECGITRLSLGVQSFHDSDLVKLGRNHDALRSAACVREARAAGFDNISMDLISALPWMSLKGWMENLERAVALSPDHISAYTLEYHPGTFLAEERAAGRLLPAQENLEREMYLKTIEFLESCGYEQYEISNFARPGFVSRHNLKYWRQEPYLGFGTSAHSFTGRRRYWNHSHWERYLTDLQAGRKPVAGFEDLNHEQLALERLMLGLRTCQGASWDGDSLPPGIPEQLVTRRNGHIALTPAGRVLYETVCEVFARAFHPR